MKNKGKYKNNKKENKPVSSVVEETVNAAVDAEVEAEKAVETVKESAAEVVSCAVDNTPENIAENTAENTADSAAEELPAIKKAIEQKAAAKANKPDTGKASDNEPDRADSRCSGDNKPKAESEQEDNLMIKWYKAAQKRVSIRKYSGTPEVSVLRELRQVAQMVSTEDARIYVGKREGIFDPLIGKTISGTEAFAAVILRSKNKYMAGFVGEAFMLECVSRGLGTCWLGLSYKKSVARAAVKLRDGERIVCLISIGKYDELPESVGTRKSVFNLTGMEDDTFYALPEWQQCAVRCARLAPSARNAQPWEFDIMPDSIQVAITSGNMGYGEIDCGIAMLHIELGAASCGQIGDWEFDEGYPVFRVIEE